MHVALLVEARKLARSRVVATATALQVIGVPVLAWLLVRAASADGVGPLAAKGQLLVIGEGWDAYVAALGQVGAAALFVGAGVVVAWIFGREHADRTFGALFALPVGRGAVAGAKLVVAAAWALAVAVGVAAVAALLGVVGGVEPGVAPPVGGVALVLVVAASTMLMALPVAIVASAGRGYLPAVGAIVVVLAVAQVSVFLGVGGWFPFAVPGLMAVADGTTIPVPHAGQLALAVAAVVTGGGATIAWWQHAEVV